MSSAKLLFSFAILLIATQIEAGFLDWFRSKPDWAKAIDKYPLIEVFHPKGLRVSIGDVDGMEIFGFHAKPNDSFQRGENGTIFGNITKPTNGRWIFIDDNIELKIDDALHYWIYVKLKGEEYSFSKHCFIIRNAAPHPGNLRLIDYVDERIGTRQSTFSDAIRNDGKPCICPAVIPAYAPVPSYDNTIVHNHDMGLSNVADVPNSPHSDIDMNEISSELIACGFQVDSLNEVILDLLKNTKMHSALVLIGKPRTSISAMEEIKKFLVQFLELYDLGKKIKKAEYLSCGIYFEMSSIVDKKRILLRATTDMRDVPCKFSEPEDAGCF